MKMYIIMIENSGKYDLILLDFKPQ